MDNSISNKTTEKPAPATLDSSDEIAQNKTMKRSRLRSHLEKQSKATLFLTGVGLITIIVLLVLFGQSALVQFSILLSNLNYSKTQSEPDQEQNLVYLVPPQLDLLPEATNSAKIKITGIEPAEIKTKIKLYINDELIDVIDSDIKGVFAFDNITLKDGGNRIKAVAQYNNQYSDNSNIIEIDYLKNPPPLSIDYPEEGKTYTGENSTITVKGKTDSGCSITVNGYFAITKNDGSYSYNFRMQSGENKIKVIASDLAGNKTEKEIKINYSH